MKAPRPLTSIATVAGMVAGLLAVAAPARAAGCDASTDPLCVTTIAWDTTPGSAAPGSLRQAIYNANASLTGGTIRFNIPGTGVHTIVPTSTSPVPEITRSAVTIDGTTQPGYAGTPLIEIDGSSNGGVGLSLSGGSDVIRGLVINRFAYGIYITSSNNTIESSYIGTNAAGNAAAPNTQYGVRVHQFPGTSVTNNTIGGAGAAARNVISGNTSAGVYLDAGSSATTVVGNYIGTNASGTAAVGNGVGIHVLSSADNVIGTAGAGNVISGNTAQGGNSFGVWIEDATSTGNSLKGNKIGTAADGSTALGNAEGILLSNSAGQTAVGGVTPGAGNTIAYNTRAGIRTSFGGSCCGTGINISSNSIFSNGGLGIDLDSNGVTPNDTLDPDPGPNNLQNFPVLSSVSVVNGSATLNGSLNSEANKQYRMEFFKSTACDAQLYGEGAAYLESVNVLTDSNGNAPVSAPNLGGTNAVAPGDYITATATDPAGNTSEFSACRQATGVPGAPRAVTAAAGDASASVSWTAPASDGGSPITGYIVTATPGGFTTSTAGATTTTMAGLANGTSYTFTVTATNALGTGPASAPSNAVTPLAGATQPQTTSQTVAAGGSASTGSSPTPTDPTTTTVALPAGGTGGTVTIAEATDPVSPATGFVVLGQQVNISAPAQTATAPMTLTFTLEATALNGTSADHVWFFRTENGGSPTRVLSCTNPSGTAASPDPCMQSRTVQQDGDLRIVILTSSASKWGGTGSTPNRVSVDPSTASVGVNAQSPLNAMQTFSDNSTSDVTGQATWTTSNASVATVSTSGVVTGIAAGTATIMATYAEMPGSSTVTVTSGTPSGGSKPVSVTDSGYSPTTLKLPSGYNSVIWGFAAANTRSHTVTDASGMGLFDSGAKSAGTSFLFRFLAAGSYKYTSTGDATSMSGFVKVPLLVSPLTGTTGTTYTVTWASAAPAAGYFSDVQYRYKPCAKTTSCTWTSWTNWQTNQTTALSAAFQPAKGAGTYQLHAHLGRAVSASVKKYSGWSTPVTLSVSTGP